jgi:hypothetical protein
MSMHFLHCPNCRQQITFSQNRASRTVSHIAKGMAWEVRGDLPLIDIWNMADKEWAPATVDEVALIYQAEGVKQTLEMAQFTPQTSLVSTMLAKGLTSHDNVTNYTAQSRGMSGWTLAACQEWLQSQGYDLPPRNEEPYTKYLDNLFDQLHAFVHKHNAAKPSADAPDLPLPQPDWSIQHIQAFMKEHNLPFKAHKREETIAYVERVRRYVISLYAPTPTRAWMRVNAPSVAHKLAALGEYVLTQLDNQWWGRTRLGALEKDATILKMNEIDPTYLASQRQAIIARVAEYEAELDARANSSAREAAPTATATATATATVTLT